MRDSLSALPPCSVRLVHGPVQWWSNPFRSIAGRRRLVRLLVSYLLGGGIYRGSGVGQYTGATAASGIFINGGTDLNTTVGINVGVVLTTGDARFVSGSAISADDFPNKTTAFGAGIGNTLTRNTSPGSSLFRDSTSAQTFNASILSFQFIPAGSSITLKYVFGSEEYGDVVNTGFPPDVSRHFRQWRQLRARARRQRRGLHRQYQLWRPGQRRRERREPTELQLVSGQPTVLRKDRDRARWPYRRAHAHGARVGWTSQHDPAWHCEFGRFVRRFSSVPTSRKLAIGSVIFPR